MVTTEKKAPGDNPIANPNEQIKGKIVKLALQGIKLQYKLFVYGKQGDKDEKMPAEFLDSIEKLDLRSGYESWYSQCLEILRVFLPARLDDFINCYRPATTRKEVTFINYTVQDALRGIVLENGFGQVKVSPNCASAKMDLQVGILRAVIDCIDNSLINRGLTS